MADARLDIQSNGGGADLLIEGGDLAIDDGLSTVVLASVFSDARAPDDDSRLGEDDDHRGWWADSDEERFGSLLWLVIERAKFTAATLAEAEASVRESLEWMRQQGIAASIAVRATRSDAYRLDIEVVIERGEAARWQALWDGERSVQAGDSRLRILTR